ncbi:MAG: 1-pyrroline-5-carboxylate dehydrogenase [Cyanobacteria bacterium P01_D01_bin.71]
MLFQHNHVYLKIKINKIWAKQLEGQTVVELCADEPFTTERLLIGNFAAALSITKTAITQVNSGKRQWVTPKVCIHPLDYTEGGLSPAEKRLFWELAASANSFDVRVWEGTELSDMQVIELFQTEASYQL